ncbi:hypothetical protein OSB04_010312 [Centaurea solstitialis]|uniref:Uncharacterized protein n=1 Tax=Centaurea solstitialis TaxID=347529 RepID=A0AA38TS54_9ASTR|nr:hypothetical protein OSB04_010312 [Centaurea solstitialis]
MDEKLQDAFDLSLQSPELNSGGGGRRLEPSPERVRLASELLNGAQMNDLYKSLDGRISSLEHFKEVEAVKPVEGAE